MVRLPKGVSLKSWMAWVRVRVGVRVRVRVGLGLGLLLGLGLGLNRCQVRTIALCLTRLERYS